MKVLLLTSEQFNQKYIGKFYIGLRRKLIAGTQAALEASVSLH